MNRRDFFKASALGAAALGFTSLTGCKVTTRQSFDTIIKNGVIYAGDGKAPITGDIAIRDGKIAALGKDLGTSADNIIVKVPAATLRTALTSEAAQALGL